MRFHPAKGLAIAGATIVVLAAAACSSSSSSAIPPTGTAPPAATTPAATSAPAATTSASASASGTGTSSGAVAQITTNWETFFNSSTPTAQRLAVLQNGSDFSSAITAFSSNPLAAGLTAKVHSVTITSPTQATVKYDLDGTVGTLLPNQVGTAVLVAGTWKVGDSSFCGLLKLAGGTLPSVCNA